MAQQVFQLTGIKEIDAALADMEKKVAKKLLKDAMKASMKPMLAAAKAAVPVETGTLKRYVKLRTAKRSRNSFGFTIGVGEKDFQGKAWYGAAVEYGTSKQEPKGYLRKAFDENKESAIRLAQQQIKAGLGI